MGKFNKRNTDLIAKRAIITRMSDLKKEVLEATDEQLKLWLGYIKLFDTAKPIEMYASKWNAPDKLARDEADRQKHKEMILDEYKKRGIRRERSRERGKGKKSV